MLPLDNFSHRDTTKSIAQIAGELNVDLMNGNHLAAVRVCDEALRSQDNLPPNLQFDPLFAPLRADERCAKLIR